MIGEGEERTKEGRSGRKCQKKWGDEERDNYLHTDRKKEMTEDHVYDRPERREGQRRKSAVESPHPYR